MTPLDATTVRGLTREEMLKELGELQARSALLIGQIAAATSAPPVAVAQLYNREEAAAVLRIAPSTLDHRGRTQPVLSFRVKVGRLTLYDAAKIAEYVRDPAGYLSRLTGPESSRPAAAPRPAPFLAASGRGRTAR